MDRNVSVNNGDSTGRHSHSLKHIFHSQMDRNVSVSNGDWRGVYQGLIITESVIIDKKNQ